MIAKPFPQGQDNEGSPSKGDVDVVKKKVEDDKGEVKEKVEDDNGEVEEKNDKDKEEVELGEAVGQVLGGLFDIFSQAVKAAGDVATDEV